MNRNKQLTTKVVRVIRGPIKLKPTQAHKNKKVYNRKNEKMKLRTQARSIPV